MLGSGISKPAGIRTGWGIVLDLIGKIALLEKADCENKPDEWYRSKYNKEPNYSEIIRILGHTSFERKNILKSYFEPNDEEKERGLKMPTKAHKAIAELVKNNFIKLIITTNFDRLLESALSELNLTYIVVQTTDDIKGIEPLCHQDCLIVKVNGDYLDTRIKNTEDELCKYDKKLNEFLYSIFSDFGLIVCGWSGQYDIALINTIKRGNNKKYGTYWTYRSELTIESKELIKYLNAEIISINDADSFFEEIKERLLALERIDAKHPISSQVAVMRLKKYISEKRNIEIYDLFKNEWEDVFEKIIADDISDETWNKDQPYNDFLSKSISRIETLQKLIVTLLKWRDEDNLELTIQLLKRFTNINVDYKRPVITLYLKLYSAITMFYTIGVTLFYKKDYSIFNNLLKEESLAEILKKLFLALDYINDSESQKPNISYDPPSPPSGKQYNFYRFMFGQRKFPLDYIRYIFQSVRESLKDYIPDDIEFETLFIRFEYFLRLHALHKYKFFKEGFLYTLERAEILKDQPHICLPKIFEVIETEIDAKQGNFEWIKLDLFNGDINELKRIKNEYDNMFYKKYSIMLGKKGYYE